MRRALLLATLAMAGSLAVASAANASLYSGIGPDYRVEFRAANGVVSSARVRTKLDCAERGGPGPGRRFRIKYGETFFPNPFGGGFREKYSTEEPGYSEGYELTGDIRGSRIVGHFRYFESYSGPRNPDRRCAVSVGFSALLQLGAS